MRRWILSMVASLACAACIPAHEGPWPCHSDADCASGERCLLKPNSFTEFVCQGANACNKDSDCGDGFWCSNHSCEAKECSYDTQCGGYRCYRDTFRCETQCYYNSDCATGFRCLGDECVSAACEPSGPGQCSGYGCVQGLCASWCNSTLACDDGASCNSFGKCHCVNDDVCGGYRCGADTCKTSCASDVDCAVGYRCGERKQCRRAE